MSITDQATAECAREQEKRECLEDDWANWIETEQPCPIPELIPAKVCAQCVNWKPVKLLHLADGTTRLAPGFCTARAAADLLQMSQSYAKHCSFYVEEIPF